MKKGEIPWLHAAAKAASLICAVWFCAAGGITAFAAGDIPVDEEHFPDEKFREYVFENFDADRDNLLSETEIEAVTEIEVSVEGISDLTGIEHFVNLQSLNCSRNNLTELDVSKNTKLKSLDFSNVFYDPEYSTRKNTISEIDLSSNAELESLICGGNCLTSLDVSKCPKLKKLDISGNATKKTNLISTIDLSNNNELTELITGSNGLESLDISRNTNLTRLTCYNENWDTVDLTDNTVLDYVYCKRTNITSLDISQNAALKKLDCSDNKLTSLDTSNNTLLEYLNCTNNKITSLDISNNAALIELYCNSNKLSYISTVNNAALKLLSCCYNELTSIDVSKSAALKTLDFSNNKITEFDLSKNTNLTSLDCGYNPLKNFDARDYPTLTNLDCSGLNLDNLDLSRNTVLYKLSCYANKLTSLDISHNNELWRVDCGKNNIPFINITNNPSLYHFYSSQNIYYLPKGTTTFDATTLEGFDKSKVSDVTGADYDPATGIFSNITGDITYTYFCGYGKDSKEFSETFTIAIYDPNVLTDESTGITITAVDGTKFDKDLTLSVRVIDPPAGAAAAWNITLLKNGAETQPGGNIRITLPVPDGADGSKLAVFRVETNGSRTNMNAVYDRDGNTLSFITDHLSKYVLSDSSVIKGDLNGDGVANNRDLIILRDFIKRLDHGYNAAADMNEDGDVNNKDLVLLRIQVSKV